MSNNPEEENYQWRNIGHQYLAAFIAGLIMFGHGTIVGWVSPALPLLLSDDTPLISGPLTNVQLSWIGSLPSFAAIFGTTTFGYISSVMGVKRAMIFLTFPSMLFWFFVYFGNTYQYLYFARLAAGISGGGMQSTVILYISEIANNNIRGRLISFLFLLRNIGLLTSFIVGAIVDYQYLPCIFIFVQIIYAITFIFLPNTPQFHLRRQQFQKAEASLKYYKGFKGKTVDESIALDKEFDHLKAIATQIKNDNQVTLKDFFEREAIVGIIVGLLITLFMQLTGCLVFVNYAVYIFEKSGSTVDPYVSSIVMAVLQICGTLCTSQLVDTLGRKIMAIISLGGCALGLFAFALYSYLHQNGYDLSEYSWVPVTSLSFVIFIANAGIVSLASVCAIEHLPTKIRTIGISISAIGLNITAFSCTKLFPILMEIIDLHGCLFIFAVSSFIGTLFVLFFVKETKGQPMDVLKVEAS